MPTPSSHPRTPTSRTRPSRSVRFAGWAALLAALLLLSGCEIVERYAGLGELYLYERLDGEGPLYDPDEGNCAVNELGTPSQGFHVAGSGFHVAGSGFHVAGSVGGMTANPPGSPVVPSDVPVALAAADGGRDAGLLIVDDFAGAGWRISNELLELDSADIGAIEALVNAGEFSHGALVMHHANATIRATGRYEVAALSDRSVTWIHRTTEARLVVRMADAQGFATNAIPPAITAGLQELAQVGIVDVAVNLSFTLVPCSVVDDFLDNLERFPEFEDYLAAVTAGQGAGAVERLIAGIRAATESDPLRDYLRGEGFVGVGARVVVAASGNFSRDYAMYPAAWPEVLGVSASEADDPRRRAFFSNAGEVLEVGAWFQIEGVGLSFPEGRRSTLAYAGTSFSSPAVAAMHAVDLGSSAPRCVLPGATSGRLASGVDADLDLASAIRSDCLP